MNITPNLDRWRAAGSWITFNGHRVFVTAQGEGTPVLLLHGFPTASYDYARLSPLLASRYRLIMFDFLGYGFSDKPRPHDYSLFEQADITQAVAAHFGVERTFWITHDMGNSVTLEILRRGTPVIDKLVMLNGSVLLDYYQPLITQKLLLHPIAGPIMSALRIIRRPVFARQFSKVFARPSSPQEIDDFWALIHYNDGAGIYHRLIQYLSERKVHEHTWLDALKRHSAPLTVIWGQRDPVSVPRIAQAVLDRRPDAVYVPFDDIGHFPQWEAPERTATAILEALS